MRIAKLISISLFLGYSLAAFSGEEESRIIELEAKWSDMFGDRDLGGIMELMAPNSVLIMPGAEPVIGIEDIRLATKAMLESEDQVSWESDFAYVSSSGDMAYDYGKATTKLPNGTSVQGNYLVVWVKQDGEWKIAADIFN
jgi:ketosteroid isomerase-like protein